MLVGRRRMRNVGRGQIKSVQAVAVAAARGRGAKLLTTDSEFFYQRLFHLWLGHLCLLFIISSTILTQITDPNEGMSTPSFARTLHTT
jgi:hypothetical protein